MSQVEDRDSDHLVSLGIVLRGKYRDIKKLRDMVSEKASGFNVMRFIYGTISSDFLYVIKDEDWRRLRDLEQQHGGDNKNG